MISFMAIDLWQELPYKFKDLNQFAFFKSVKNNILSQIIKSKFPQIKSVKNYLLSNSCSFNLAIRLSVLMFLYIFFQMIWRLTR